MRLIKLIILLSLMSSITHAGETEETSQIETPEQEADNFLRSLRGFDRNSEIEIKPEIKPVLKPGLIGSVCRTDADCPINAECFGYVKGRSVGNCQCLAKDGCYERE